MAATKFATGIVTSINASNAPEQLRRLGEHCIKQAYAGNMEDTQYALDNLVQWARKPFASWLRRVGGLEIVDPAVGSARYTAQSVRNPKAQAKSIAAAKETPVMDATHAVKAAPKAKELKGEAKERANKAIERLLATLKKSDPEAAAILGARMSRNVSSDEIIIEDGEEEFVINKLELVQSLRKAA